MVIKKIILIIIIFLNISCKSDISNSFIINNDSIIISKTITGYNHNLKYMYNVKHNSRLQGKYFSSLKLYTDSNFKVGDTIVLKIK